MVENCTDPWHVTNEVFTIVRFLRCGFFFLNPRPKAENMGLYYPSNYYINRGQSWQTETDNRNVLLRLLYRYFAISNNKISRDHYQKRINIIEEFCSGGRIIDVGCGEGTFLGSLDKKKWERHGIDFSGDAISEAKRLGIENLYTGNLWDVDLENNYFTVATLWHVLEHVYYLK